MSNLYLGMKNELLILVMVLSPLILTAQNKVNKGIGPISEISLGELDEGMAKKGKMTFSIYCSACHKEKEDYIGPPPWGIMSRRSPEWIMNMILNTEEMLEKDKDAKALFVKYNQNSMANMGLSEKQAREILEYFRTLKD